MRVENLAYVGLCVSNLSRWEELASGVIGLQRVDHEDVENRYYALDHRDWRIMLMPGSDDDLRFIGLEVAASPELQALRGDLEARGFDCRDMPGEERLARGIEQGIQTTDPNGLTIELVTQASRNPEADPPTGTPEFLTGKQGLGHVVLYTADIDSSLAFYQLLGFSISDYIRLEITAGQQVTVTFLHCNARHHSIALVPVSHPRKIDHLMLETTSIDPVIRAYYRAQADNFTISRGLGRHPNDRMLSFYVQTPSGFDIELGHGGREIDPDWQIETYHQMSCWGHQPPHSQPSATGGSAGK